MLPIFTLLVIYFLANTSLVVENFTPLHTFLEICGIFVCFSIATYSWQAYKYEQSAVFLWTPFIFITIGILDYFHTFSFFDMPQFITENTAEKTMWFWIFSRMLQSVSLFLLITYSSVKQLVSIKNRIYFFLSTIIIITIISFTIIYFEPNLPLLIDQNNNTTLLKALFEWFTISFQLLSILFLFTSYFDVKQFSKHDLLYALFFLCVNSFLLSAYNIAENGLIIIAHVFKLLGFVYIYKAFYYSQITLSFAQKKEIKNNLKERDTLLQSFINHTKEGIMLTNMDGEIKTINSAFRDIYGLSNDDVTGKHINDILPRYQLPIQKLCYQIIHGIPVENYEFKYVRNDGRTIYIQITLSPIYDEQGEMEYISGISRDITEQKKAHMLQEQAELELKNAVKLQQGIIFKYRSRNGQFIFSLWDGLLNEKLKVNPDEIIYKNVHSDFYEKFPGLLAYQQLAWKGNAISFELPFQKEILLYVTLNPVFKNGKVDSVIGSCIEITQLRNTENLLQKKEKLAVVGQMAAGVAHEIRNPLTTLKGFSQLLHNNLLSTSNREYLEIIMAEIDRIELITNEFLVVAKPQALVLKHHNISTLIEQVIFFLQHELSTSNIQIETEFQTSILHIECDGNQIKQVFINLLKNSIEAMPNGGNLKILVQETDERYLKVDIVDNGIGIPQEIIPKLGEPFYTLKEKGTGLGLMVSYRIMEANKGKIYFSSKENIGTKVELLLPK